MRLVATLVLVLATTALTGCGSTSTQPRTALTIVAVNESVGRAAFHLECAPSGGDLPKPAKACAALASAPTLVTNPKPFVCAGGMFSWWDITISGRLHGRALKRHVSTCWTPQMAVIGRLGLGWSVLQKHLLPRRHQELIGGEQRTFSARLLRPGDLVTCDIRGHHLEAGIPSGAGPERDGYGGANIVSVTLAVARHVDGSVTADCHVGSP